MTGSAIGTFIIGVSAIGVSGGADPLGYEQLLDLSAATPLTPPIGAMLAIIKAEGAPVRYRDDGVAPDLAVGMPLEIGEQLNYSGALAALAFIEQSVGAKLNVLYYGATS